MPPSGARQSGDSALAEPGLPTATPAATCDTSATPAASETSTASSNGIGARAEVGDEPQKSPPGALEMTSIPSKPNVISATDLDGLHPVAGQRAAQRLSASGDPAGQSQQWLAQVAAQTHLEVRQRMSQAGDQLNQSIRQIYASASSIAAEMPPSYHNIPGIVPFNQGRSVGPPPSYDDVINPYAPPPTYQSLFGQMCEARKRSRGLFDLLSRLFIILISTIGCTILIAFMILIPFTMIVIGAAYIDECRIEHIPAFLLVGGLVWASKSILHCYSQCLAMPPSHDDRSSDLGALDHLYLSASSISLASSAGSGSSSGGMVVGVGSSDILEPREASVAAAAAAAVGGSTAATSDGPESDLRSSGQNGTRNSNWSRHRERTRRHRSQRPEHLYSAANEAATGSTSRLKSSICESLLNCVLFGWFIAGCVIVFRNYEPDFENPASPCYCHKTVYMYTFWLITSAVILLGLFIGCVCCLIVSSAVASRESEPDDELA